jgi:hypothetical protein
MASAASNSLTEHVNAVVNTSVYIEASTKTICSGAPVTFTAYPVNGRRITLNQWQVNGSNKATGNNLFVSNALVNGDIVRRLPDFAKDTGICGHLQGIYPGYRGLPVALAYTNALVIQPIQ